MKRYEFKNKTLTGLNKALAKAREMLYTKNYQANGGSNEWKTNLFTQSSLWKLAIDMSKIMCSITQAVMTDKVFNDAEKKELLKIIAGIE